MNKNIVKVLAILVLVCTFGSLMVACKKHEHTFVEGKCECGETDPNYKPEETPALGDYKLGLGTVISLDSSATETAQIDGTIAAVVLDKDGKIVLCRIDAIQNKIKVKDGFIDMPSAFKTKMELGSDYGMSTSPYSSDNNGDGVIKEWFEQAKAFENYVVGKTVAEVEAIKTQTLENGYVIGTDDALLSAGCTIQITDFIAAVAKACKDDQAVSFQSAGNFTLGVAANSYNDSSKDAEDEETDGVVQVYSDIAASVVEGGKIVASLNDAVQPKVSFNVAGEITKKDFKGTKRELKEGYNMAAYGQPNVEGGTVKEWYIQSEAFSNYVVEKGMTATEIAGMQTKEVNNHQISVDEALLNAGCTMQITGICAVVAQAANNAR
jgi:hypothetical protein